MKKKQPTLEQYKHHFDAISEVVDFSPFGRTPKNRYYTYKYCFDYLNSLSSPRVAELGTTRSFVGGQYEGCYSDDPKYWEPDNPEKWDFGAGAFTYLCAELVPGCELHTVDLATQHIERCKVMTSKFDNVTYHVDKSERFLKRQKKPFDLIYMDTGDMFPIGQVSKLHLREAKIMVRRDLVAARGLVLIDDVMNPKPLQNGERSHLGKAKASIPYWLQHDFNLVMNEYQWILRKG